jgi:hypothetical protein
MHTLLGVIVGVLLAVAVLMLARGLRKRPPKRCSTCKHFDLQEGQAAMQAHPVFMQAAGVLSPSKMGTVVTYDEDGTRHESGPAGVPMLAKWNQFGACLCPEQADTDGSPILKWGGDICPDFQRGAADQVPALVQLRPR